MYGHQFGTLGRKYISRVSPRHPIFSMTSLLVRPCPYRVAPAAGESCGLCTCSIACSHVIPGISIPPWASRQEVQHTQHPSWTVHLVLCARPAGPFGKQGLFVFSFETCASYSKKHGQGGNAKNLFALRTNRNQSATTIGVHHVPLQPFQRSLEKLNTDPQSSNGTPAGHPLLARHIGFIRSGYNTVTASRRLKRLRNTITGTGIQHPPSTVGYVPTLLFHRFSDGNLGILLAVRRMVPSAGFTLDLTHHTRGVR